MKKIIHSLLIVLLTMLVGSFSNDIFAQGKGKGNKKPKVEKKHKQQGPPSWAPAHGYRSKTRYVYFKDHDVYYDNDRGVYISLSGKNWKVDAKLPDVLRKVDLKLATKVDIDFAGDNPYVNHKSHLKAHPKSKN